MPDPEVVYRSPTANIVAEEKSHSQTLRVFSALTDPLAVALLGPAPGSAGPNGLRVQSVSAQEEAPGVWNQTITYSSRVLQSSGEGGGPRRMPRWGKWARQVAVEHDTRPNGGTLNPNNRSARKNSAGMPLPKATRNETWPSVTIPVYSSDPPSLGHYPLIGTVNSAALTLVGISIPPLCARFADLQPEPLASGFWIWYTFELCFAEAPQGRTIGGSSVTGFLEWAADAGNYELTNDGLIPIIINNVQVSEPVYLDGAGAKLAANQPPVFFDHMSDKIGTLSTLPTTKLAENPFT